MTKQNIPILSSDANQKELAKVYLQAGEEELLDGVIEDAATYFTYAIENDPSLEEAWFGLVTAYMQDGDTLQAEREAKQMTLQFPESSQAFALLGNALRCRGKSKDSLREFDRAIALSAECYLAYYGRAIAKDLLNDSQGALTDFERCLQISPEFVPAWYDRGVLLTTEGRLEEAVASYSKALEIDPDFAQAYITRGDLFSVLGDHTKAIQDFTKAVEIDPNNPDAWYYRALAWEQKGDPKKSKMDYQKAIELGFIEEE